MENQSDIINQNITEYSSIRKKVCVLTWGCQMNVYDSERIEDVTQANGYDKTNSMDDADWVILNTCHIREKAAEKVYSQLGQLRIKREKRRRNGGDLFVAVAGCVGQAEGEEIIKRADVVSIVVGPQTYHRIAELMFAVEKTGDTFCDLDFPASEKFGALDKLSHVAENKTIKLGKPSINFGSSVINSKKLKESSQFTKTNLSNIPQKIPQKAVSTFLTIQEGCDKFCSFCVVPYTRGGEFSRPPEQIFQEAQNQVNKGSKEITLLGQNVNAWEAKDSDGKTWRLADLMYKLSEIEGLLRIRYTTSHPCDMDENLISAHREFPKVMPYLHLPVQSGSSKILQKMNRRHDREFYIEMIRMVRAARPDIAISGDFIVGFPGETEEDFEDTLSLIHEIQYAKAYSFTYSPREGTPAASDEQVDPKLSHQRLLKLQAKLLRQQRIFNDSVLGSQQEVLFDKKSKHIGQIQGRTVYNQVVYCESNESMIGKIANLSITSSSDNALRGKI